jgi:hypothetical protein
MKIIVAIIVYDRIQNIQEWIRCWQVCEKYENAELVVIQNKPDDIQANAMQVLCESNGIKYFVKENIGYDIARLKDVFEETIEGFPNDWTHLIWFTDDCLPMDRNFIKRYIDKLIQPNVGVVCYELSDEYKTHIRTTGFAIIKEVARQIHIPSVITKEDCWQFEHRSPNAFYEQVKRLGLEVKMVSALERSVVWDSGKWRVKKNREKEHYQVFPKEEKSTTQKVAIICPIYKQFPMIIGSMIAQTHKNWKMLLVHDGEDELNIKAYVEFLNDPRIKFEVSEKVGYYGHPIRQKSLERMKAKELFPDSNYVLITNGDNYHMPTFLEFMLRGFNKDSIVATYCRSMVHDYLRYGIIHCKLELGHIDCASVLVRKDIACDVGWKSKEHSSDWLYFKDIMDKYGKGNWNAVDGCLMVHN